MIFLMFLNLIFPSSQSDTYGEGASKPFTYHNIEFTAPAAHSLKTTQVSKETVEELILNNPRKEIIISDDIHLFLKGLCGPYDKCSVLSILRY